MRQEFPSKVQLAAYRRSLGPDGKPHCEVEWDGVPCGKLILGVPEYDHKKADGLGGLPTLENCQVACGACHKIKTHTEDRPIMQAADNQLRSQAGIKRKGHRPLRSRNTFARYEPAELDPDT